MKVAQVAPLYESVPPKLYGGTERVVSFLTEELVRQGHKVTLFGSGDSQTSAELVPVTERALRLNPAVKDGLAHHILQLEMVRERMEEFDVIHYHTDYLHFPLSAATPSQRLTTLHGRLDIPDLYPLYTKFKNEPLVSISDSQRIPLREMNWAGTVYHGLPLNLYKAGPGKGGYLAFLGRISPEKRPDRAIEIAKRTGIPLKIAAKVDIADQKYYEEAIRPLMDHPLVEFVGEIGENQKGEFLGNALALLFPVDWPEPFGMVMIESMAAGTPVIAWNQGSVPEVIRNGISGHIADNMEDAIRAVENLHKFDRSLCRKEFEDRFSAKRMALDYTNLYERVAERRRTSGTWNLSLALLKSRLSRPLNFLPT